MAFQRAIESLLEFFVVEVQVTDDKEVLSKFSDALVHLAPFKAIPRNLQLLLSAGVKVDPSFEDLFSMSGYDFIRKNLKAIQAIEGLPKNANLDHLALRNRNFRGGTKERRS